MPAPSRKQTGADRREGPCEGDEHDGEPVVGASGRQTSAVEDDQHGEVGKGQELLDHKQEIGRLPDRMEAVPNRQKVPGEEDAEEKGRKQAAENELPPIVPRAHFSFDAGGPHFRRQSISRYSAQPPASWFALRN